MTIPVAVTELIGTFFETLFYGIYIVILPKCLDILRKKNVGRGLMSYLLITMVLSFFLITAHLVVDLIRAFAAFTGNMDIPGSPDRYYDNINTSLNLSKNSFYIADTLLSDALLLYRAFIIWGRNYWVIVLPTMLYMLDIAMSIWFTWSITQASPGNSVMITTAFARSKYFYAATLALNLLCTSLIAFKIWDTQRKIAGYSVGSNRKDAVLSAVLESASIYTAFLFALIGTSVAGSSTMLIFLNLMPPVVGSVFTYVIMRCSMDNAPFHVTERSGESNLNRPGSNHNGSRLDSVYYRSGGVIVDLEQIVHHDIEPRSEYNGSHKDNKSFV